MLAVKKKEEPKAKEKMQPTLVTSGDGPFGGRVEVHTLQVRWHAAAQEDSIKNINLPVLSCDTFGDRLATGGGDNCGRIWRLEKKDADMHAVFQATLSGHEKSVNVVRFSTCGKYLATGGDDGLLLVWTLDEERSAEVRKDNTEEAQEIWRVECRTHLPTDVYDIAWAPRTLELMVASTDHKCVIFNMKENGLNKIAELSQHHKYVQGVAYDPRYEFATSASNDRSVRVYSLWSKANARRKQPQCSHVLKKAMAAEDGAKGEGYFHDDTVPTFFRRIAWSPDGNLLVCPTGKVGENNSTFVFARAALPYAVLELPCGKFPSVCVRFSPILYNLVPDVEPLFDLPYRMVYAVGTTDSTVLIYDTQHIEPIYRVAGIHYEPINDVSFSPDGNELIIASTDGYCSIVRFEDAALGKPLSEDARADALKVLEAHFEAMAKKEQNRERAKAEKAQTEGDAAEGTIAPSPSKKGTQKSIVEALHSVDPSKLKQPEEFVEEELDLGDEMDMSKPVVVEKKE